MKELLKFLVEKITGSNDFSVDEGEEDGRTMLTIEAKPDIIGLIIGKGGKTIKNIRKIVAIRAVLLGKSININVKEKTD